MNGVNKKYASDPKWASKVEQIMGKIVVAGIDNPEQLIEIANIKWEAVTNVQS